MSFVFFAGLSGLTLSAQAQSPSSDYFEFPDYLKVFSAEALLVKDRQEPAVFPLPTQSLIPYSPSRNQKLILPYLNSAQEYFASQNYIKSLDLLNRALELYPESSDLLFVKAFVLFREFGKGAEAVELLQKALAEVSWFYYDPRKSQTLEAQLLLQQGRYSELETLLDSLDSLALEDPALQALKAQILLKTNRGAEAARILERLQTNFVSNAAVKKLSLELNQSEFLSDHYWFERYATSSFAYLELLAQRICLLDVSKEQRKSIAEYFLKGGKDPWVYAWALENLVQGNVFSPEDYPELPEEILANLNLSTLKAYFTDSTRPLDQDILIWMLERNILGQTDSVISPEELFLGPRLLYRDQDRNSLAEQVTLVTSGIPQATLIDQNQDGKPEYFIQFSKGIPEAFLAYGSDYLNFVKYSSYPEIQYTAQKDAESARVFSLKERHKELVLPQMQFLNTAFNAEYLATLFQNFRPLNLAAAIDLQKESEYISLYKKQTDGRFYLYRQEFYLNRTLFLARENKLADASWGSLQLYDEKGLKRFEAVSLGKEVYTIITLGQQGTKEFQWYYSRDENVKVRLDFVTRGLRWDLNNDGYADSKELSVLIAGILGVFEKVSW